MTPDLIASVIGFLLTVMTLSYMIGDGPLFRIAVHIFVGISAGYIVWVAGEQVIMPTAMGLFSGSLLSAVPLALGVLLMMKASRPLSPLGSPVIAFMVGVSAAVVISGAINGTILPQMTAATDPFKVSQPIGTVINGVIMMVATITVLVYFQFGAKRMPDGTLQRNRIVTSIAWAGGLFIALTLGILFAGVYSAALTALVERIDSIFVFIFSLMGPL